MGDAESLQPSKKRAAGIQLSRDNPGLDDEEETPQGTFKKASEDVLATRRIVKVRRHQTSTPAAPPPSASNPFAAIRLVTPPSSTPLIVETPSGQSKEAEQIDKIKSENNVDEPSKDLSTTKEEKIVNDDNTKEADNNVEDSKVQLKDENDIVVNKIDVSTTTKEETIVNDDNTKQAENKVDESKAQLKDENDIVVNKDKEESVVEEIAESGSSGNGVIKSTEVDTSETQTGKGVKDEKEKENEAKAENNDETVPFGSFQQLSSSQNAFSGLTGTGFSSSSFSFGSLNKDGAGLKSDSSTFSFGVSSNGNSSIFGSCVPISVGQSEGIKFPPMQEVALETGEENESAVFTADSILFEYIDGAWKERGKGELKVNVSTAGAGKARLVMRARGNYRLILNAGLYPDMKLTNMDKKGITFACLNSAGEGKDTLSTIALKFKDPSIVDDFRAAVTNHKCKAPAAAGLRTPENSPKANE